MSYNYTEVYTDLRTIRGSCGLTVEFVDLVQVWKNAGQVGRVEHQSHLLVENLVENLQRAQVRHLGGEEL